MTKRDRFTAVAMGALVVLAGCVLVAVRFLGEDPMARNGESLTAAIAMGAVVAAPGVLAMVGAAAFRPALLCPAAVVLVPLSFLSFALVTLPLLIPAVLLGRIWVRSLHAAQTARSVASGAVAAVALVGAAGLLVLMTGTRTFTDGSSSYTTSGWAPWSTSAIVLALVVGAIGGAVVLAPSVPSVGM